MPLQNQKILISTVGHILAHVGRTILIGKALRERGFQVFFSGQGRYLELAEKENFEVISLEGVDGKHLLKQARRKMPGVNIFTADGFDSLVQLELKLLDKLRPGAVVHDLQPTMGVSAPIAGIPCISVVNAYITRYAIPPMEKLIFH